MLMRHASGEKTEKPCVAVTRDFMAMASLPVVVSQFQLVFFIFFFLIFFCHRFKAIYATIVFLTFFLSSF